MCYAVPIGAIAQLGERVLCKHEVVGSIPSGSTRSREGVAAIADYKFPKRGSASANDIVN